MELQPYAANHIAHRQERDYLEFRVQPESPQKYRDWHRKVEVFYA